MQLPAHPAHLKMLLFVLLAIHQMLLFVLQMIPIALQLMLLHAQPVLQKMQ
jgi:hypothetical protein